MQNHKKINLALCAGVTLFALYECIQDAYNHAWLFAFAAWALSFICMLENNRLQKQIEAEEKED